MGALAHASESVIYPQGVVQVGFQTGIKRDWVQKMFRSDKFFEFKSKRNKSGCCIIKKSFL